MKQNRAQKKNSSRKNVCSIKSITSQHNLLHTLLNALRKNKNENVVVSELMRIRPSVQTHTLLPPNLPLSMLYTRIACMHGWVGRLMDGWVSGGGLISLLTANSLVIVLCFSSFACLTKSFVINSILNLVTSWLLFRKTIYMRFRRFRLGRTCKMSLTAFHVSCEAGWWVFLAMGLAGVFGSADDNSGGVYKLSLIESSNNKQHR